MFSGTLRDSSVRICVVKDNKRAEVVFIVLFVEPQADCLFGDISQPTCA